ncbi:hypothetical protein LJR289_002235 [Pseudoduganella sp. LjRoot289]|uniref:hypothetical protein n=1 Tax=Pseudoduganella sp. LjRoot289 TaxID=3342314 RepID=UPI003ECF4FEF
MALSAELNVRLRQHLVDKGHAQLAAGAAGCYGPNSQPVSGPTCGSRQSLLVRSTFRRHFLGAPVVGAQVALHVLIAGVVHPLRRFAHLVGTAGVAQSLAATQYGQIVEQCRLALRVGPGAGLRRTVIGTVVVLVVAGHENFLEAYFDTRV